MSREDDRGIELEQALLDARLRIKMQAAKDKPLDTSNPSGECWHCGEPTGLERRWCNRDCADEWGREQ